MQKKILFLVPYPVGESPSQRFRFEQYFHILRENGYVFTIQSFLSVDNWRVFYEKGKIFSKGWALIEGFIKRIGILFSTPSFDFIFIHREAAPIGPPVFEWIVAKILRKKIIYDFDDAIWMTDNTKESGIARLIRWRAKVKSICKWSHKVSCGNDYLRSFAKQYNSSVVLNPTTIDTTGLHKPSGKKDKNKVTIGWTGSHSTLKYLTAIESVLAALENRFPQVEVAVIANRKPSLNLKSLRFIPWQIETEAADLAQIDIGIMPLPDDEWSKGKCGFKALQYMAMETPTVASAVGANRTIVDHGINGFLATSNEEWANSLTDLIQDEGLRKRMGEQGRKKVIAHYSVGSNTSVFLSLFLL